MQVININQIKLNKMASVSININFKNQAEEAFNFYKSIFGGELEHLMRWGDVPSIPGQTPPSEADKNLITHVELPIFGNFMLMGGDVPSFMLDKVIVGNNANIVLQPDTRGEADRIFKALSMGGVINMPLETQFWGDYFGALTDKFGTEWMFNCTSKT